MPDDIDGGQAAEPQLNVGDIDILIQVVDLAYKRNAFHMEEVAQLLPVKQRLEAWVKYFKDTLEKENEQ